MKLLYITNGINGSGGLERVLSVKASYLADKLDYEVHILVMNDAHENPFYKFSPKIGFHSINVTGNAINYFILYRKGIKKIIKEVQPDVISVCDDGLKGMLFPIIFGKKIPIIYERHVSKQIEIKKDDISIFEKLKTKLRYKLMNYGGKQFNRFVVLTESNRIEWNLSNLTVIPNPLPFQPERTANLANKKILAVGKQSYQKAYDRLLEVWKIVNKSHPDWQLEIYGKLNPDLGLESYLRKNNLEASVHFYPPVSNIEKKYLDSSIYVLSSRFEGFGMVLIEAMIHGLPCVAFDCPHGPSDIICDKKDGILVKNGDIERFSKALIELMDNYDKRLKMGQLAKENVKRYLVSNVMPQWDSLFKSIQKNL